MDTPALQNVLWLKFCPCCTAGGANQGSFWLIWLCWLVTVSTEPPWKREMNYHTSFSCEIALWIKAESKDSGVQLIAIWRWIFLQIIPFILFLLYRFISYCLVFHVSKLYMSYRMLMTFFQVSFETSMLIALDEQSLYSAKENKTSTEDVLKGAQKSPILWCFPNLLLLT